MDAHLAECKKAITSRNGAQLSKLFALPVGSNQPDSSNQDIIKRSNSGANVSNICRKAIPDEHLSALAYHRVTTLSSIAASNWSAAVDGSLSMYNSLLEYLKDDNTAWALPTLVKLSNDVRLLAIMVSSSPYLVAYHNVNCTLHCSLLESRHSDDHTIFLHYCIVYACVNVE